MKEALLYEKMAGEKVRCRLCHHRCVITGGGRGICGVRENRAGTLMSLVYGRIIAGHCDPIEKKPLFHFLPGTRSYSIATVGCNFRCAFCQNADISQMPADHNRIVGEETGPEAIVDLTLRHGAHSISYTYTEPIIYVETALDTARAAVANGLKNVFVSNGYMSRECLEEIRPYLHAANVDLKAFNDRFYRDQCGARLGPVLETIGLMREMGIWLEVTTLLIPGLNDSEEELEALARFLAGIDPGIPWHISRFHPTYRLMDRPVTPVRAIQKARDIGYGAGLQYVYTGNIPGDDGERTFCHACQAPLIDRVGFQVGRNRLTDGRCPVCGETVPGIWCGSD
jgi:pyruvate formate lyase activating enzyme